MTLLKAPSNLNNGHLDQFVLLDMCDLSLSSVFAAHQAVIIKVKLPPVRAECHQQNIRSAYSSAHLNM